MNQAVRVVFDPLRSAGFAAIAAGTTIVGTKFAHPIRLLIMQNLTNQEIGISFDNISAHMVLPSGGQIVLDFASDASAVAGIWSMSVGDAVYVTATGAVPTSGNFYVSAAYGKGE